MFKSKRSNKNRVVPYDKECSTNKLSKLDETSPNEASVPNFTSVAKVDVNVEKYQREHVPTKYAIHDKETLQPDNISSPSKQNPQSFNEELTGVANLQNVVDIPASPITADKNDHQFLDTFSQTKEICQQIKSVVSQGKVYKYEVQEAIELVEDMKNFQNGLLPTHNLQHKFN